MSGIAGIFYPDVFQVNHLIAPMLSTLEHRGKDVRDSYTFRNFQMGICGGKIAANEKKNLFCCLDGYIYNRKELINDLKNSGIEFPNENPTDAALIIQCFELWGIDFISKLNGDFAIALFNQSTGELNLVRDRIGIKPLFWFHNQNHFIFASEIKAMLATGVVPQSLANDALCSYLYFGYIPQDLTPVVNVSKLLPGHFLSYSMHKSMLINSYWSLSYSFSANRHDELPTIIRNLDSLLTNSVKSRLPEEGPIGCFVSGGLGSACTAYYVEKLSNKIPVEAFTAGFQAHNDVDIAAASEVTKTLHIPHHVASLTPDDLIKDLDSIVWYLDEPFADPVAISSWYLAKIASGNATTAFSGMGSDELVAGHSRYSNAEEQTTFLTNSFSMLKELLKPILLPILKISRSSTAFKYLKKSRTNPWQFEYMQRSSLFDTNTLSQAAPKLVPLFNPETFLHKFHHLDRISSKVSALLYLDLKTRMVDCYVPQLERSCSANGIAWHAPFLDLKVIEYLVSLPEPDVITEGETGNYLKKLLQGVFPEKFLRRPKRTRQSFLSQWGNLPMINAPFKDLIHSSVVETGIISEAWIREKLNNLETSPTSFKLLWGVLILETWIQLFINKRITVKPPE